MYNHEKINAAIDARKKMRASCRLIVEFYMPVKLPEHTVKRICTRRKLYNFLESLDFTHSMIQGIFWQYNIAVPRDTKLKPAYQKPTEEKPAWLTRVNVPDSDLDINI